MKKKIPKKKIKKVYVIKKCRFCRNWFEVADNRYGIKKGICILIKKTTGEHFFCDEFTRMKDIEEDKQDVRKSVTRNS